MNKPDEAEKKMGRRKKNGERKKSCLRCSYYIEVGLSQKKISLKEREREKKVIAGVGGIPNSGANFVFYLTQKKFSLFPKRNK